MAWHLAPDPRPVRRRRRPHRRAVRHRVGQRRRGSASPTRRDRAARPGRTSRSSRDGNTVVARTELGRAERVVLAGHLDTVPMTEPTTCRPGARATDLYGRGTVDMKGGVAVQLRLALRSPSRQPRPHLRLLRLRGGRGRAQRPRAAWAATAPSCSPGDFAMLLEPTDGAVEGGCQGTLRVDVTAAACAAHSARSWIGDNAIHAAATVLAPARRLRARDVDVDGLDYREGAQRGRHQRRLAGNVIPDECVVTVNYRFAPDRRRAGGARPRARSCSTGTTCSSPTRPPAPGPACDRRRPRRSSRRVGGAGPAKLGWTDVARFGALGIPAVNFGPGDPNLAHHDRGARADRSSWSTPRRRCCAGSPDVRPLVA